MPNLIREARELAGLTQTELSQRSGIAQSTISAYESGQRDPGWRVVGRIVDAAGFEIVLRPRRPSPEVAGRRLAEVMELAHVIKRSRVRA